MSMAESSDDETDQKRVATRRLGDPVPGAEARSKRNIPKAPKRKKARR